MARDQTPPDKIAKVNKVVAGLALFYGLLFLWLIAGSYTLQWQWTGIADRTVWDWMELLLAVAVPVLIGVYGGTISRIQYEGQREAERRRGQDEALQAYLDQLGQLLLEQDRSLRQSERGSEVRTLARARTLTVLPRLDGHHKARVVQFLYESRLIDKDELVVALVWADLSEANLLKADLSKANLTKAQGLTDDQLSASRHFPGATMPNGQKYEDWLKSKGR